MAILGIIPARAGSKRLPGKNKKKLNGKELVRYAIEAARGSKLVTDWVLTTDDDDILAIAADYPWLTPLRRPSDIAGDEAGSITYVRHALETIDKKYDHTVIIQVTSPFTLAEDIDGTVNLLYTSGAASSVSVEKIDFAIHPIKLKTMEGNRLLPFLEAEDGRMSAAELPTIYVRNGSVYASTIETIHSGLIVAEDCVGYVMPRERSVDINDPIDFAFAEFVLGSSPFRGEESNRSPLKGGEPGTTSIAYVATHGFAARMIMQTDLLGKLVQSGCSVALITPDRNDPVLKAYCESRGIAHYDFTPPQSRKKGEYFRLRKYLLDDIKANPTLWERHVLATKYASRRRPWSQVRPRLYMLGYRLRKLFPGIRDWYQRKERKFLENEEALTLLREINPEIFVSTYPVNFGEGMLQSAARRHGCKTVIHLLSWDNISSKGTFSEMAEHYLLWGESMRDELEVYYGITGDKVHLTGVPHFDLHVANRKNPQPGPFLEKLGLDPAKPYLFFGMSSAHFAPREIDIVERLVDQIQSNEFGNEMQLVVRPHPQNITGFLAEPSWLPRLEALVGDRVSVDFPSLVKSKMAWSMAAHDMDRLSNLIAGSRLVYNTGSTISIDAMMCDVPVILTSFDADEEVEYWKSARRLLDYEHLRKLSATGALSIARSFPELTELTHKYLKNSSYLEEPRLATIRNYCSNYDEGQATELVRKTLVGLLHRDPSIMKTI